MRKNRSSALCRARSVAAPVSAHLALGEGRVMGRGTVDEEIDEGSGEANRTPGWVCRSRGGSRRPAADTFCLSEILGSAGD